MKYTGVIEQKFEFNGNVYHVFDTGGEKSERKRWHYCYEQVATVIFVVSLNSFDCPMWEDDEKNMMVDSIETFEQICNNEELKDSVMILFLNQIDLFAEKIKTVPITQCPSFASYNGDTKNYDHLTAYIKEIFENCNKNDTKQIYTYLTCAVDKNQVAKVFDNIF